MNIADNSSLDDQIENYFKTYEEREVLKEILGKHKANKEQIETTKLMNIIRDKVIFFEYFYKGPDEHLSMFFVSPKEGEYDNFDRLYKEEDYKYEEIVAENYMLYQKACNMYKPSKYEGLYAYLCGSETRGTSAFHDQSGKLSERVIMDYRSRFLFRNRINSYKEDMDDGEKIKIKEELIDYFQNLIKSGEKIISDIVMEKDILSIVGEKYTYCKKYDFNNKCKEDKLNRTNDTKCLYAIPESCFTGYFTAYKKWVYSVVSRNDKPLNEVLRQFKEIGEEQKNEITSDAIKEIISLYLEKLIINRESEKEDPYRGPKGRLIDEIIKNKYIEEIKFNHYKIYLENENHPTLRDKAKIDLFNALVDKLRNKIKD